MVTKSFKIITIMKPKPKTPHLDALEKLIGLARGEYHIQHAKAIRKEIAALRKYRAR